MAEHIFHKDFKTMPWWWEWWHPSNELSQDPPLKTDVLVVGAGYGGLRLTTTDGVVGGSDSNTDFTWQAGAGITWRLKPRVTLDVGYRYMDWGHASIDQTSLSSGLPAGKFTADLTSHQLFVGLRFQKSFYCMRVVCAHGNLRDIDIAIAYRSHSEIFLRRRFAARGKLRDGAQRCGLRGLTSSVGINFGIQYKNIDVLTTSQHMIQAPVTTWIRVNLASSFSRMRIFKVCFEGNQSGAPLTITNIATGFEFARQSTRSTGCINTHQRLVIAQLIVYLYSHALNGCSIKNQI